MLAILFLIDPAILFPLLLFFLTAAEFLPRAHLLYSRVSGVYRTMAVDTGDCVVFLRAVHDSIHNAAKLRPFFSQFGEVTGVRLQKNGSAKTARQYIHKVAAPSPSRASSRQRRRLLFDGVRRTARPQPVRVDARAPASRRQARQD